MQKITTFLTFKEGAAEAMNFYTSIFKNSKINETMPGPDGSVLSGTFELDGQPFMALNGGPHFTFTEAFSLMVSCNTQEEIDHYWEKLSEGGAKSRCGWLKDKFGVSWQVTPPMLLHMLSDKDRKKAGQVMEAMMKMDKIDIQKLKEAYDK